MDIQHATYRPLFGAAMTTLALLAVSCSPPEADEDNAALPGLEADAMRGKTVFVQAGCVICHQANGVGGMAGPSLRAERWDVVDTPYDFAARMWAGAPQMIALQRLQLGYEINLSGQDLADVTAFAMSEEAQTTLEWDEVPEDIKALVLDVMYTQEELVDVFNERDLLDQ